ncbi:hypothetical protein [Acinetobacter sp. MD2(2019)]|uniref:hypothetical protein n=1 Tax=Acinetobacter sp. MD2(2019) TaxID=2605273 RepID=UPI002D1F11D1|nr:hypothetical protein [Acinetobacter sp. MD2(2019)]MEB3753815.1 hypothetical protein [Acinetobacter sp. MD2(2019)]
MNDFFLAKNATLTLNYNNQDFEVRQVQVKDFDLWLSVAEEVKNLVDTKNYSDEFLQSLFEQAPIQCLQLVSIVTDIPEQLMLDCILPALKLVLTVNEAFFHEQAEKQKSSRGRRNQQSTSDESSWFDLFQLLVRYGHSHESIMNMSYGTFKKYVSACIKQQKNEALGDLNTMRVAQHADKKGVERYVDSLNITER